MKIKTRESLKTIKTFDRSETLAQKTKNGVSSLRDSAEQTQNANYESETEYAGNELRDKEERIGRNLIYGADRIGRWGVRETRRNIQKWRNRPRKPKVNPKLKQLPSPQRKALQAPKNGVKAASKGTKTAAKCAKATAKTTAKATKASVKAAQKAAQAAKAAVKATVQFVKVAVKAVIAAAKATVAALKGIVAAIAAGGWVAVLIIVIVVLVGLVVGSVYAIFVPSESGGITIYGVMSDLEREYHEKQNELAASCQYDVLNYDGDLAAWDEMLAVYAVKLNLGDEPQEVATFDESKAEHLRAIFWDMNELSLMSETRVSYVTHTETDEKGNVTETVEEISTVYLTVVTTSKSAAQTAELYGFNEQQIEVLDELLDERNADLWAGLLGGG